MPLPVTFANLPTGNNPASLLDQSFSAVAAMGTTYCTATGTNTILLTVAPNQPTPTGYANGQQFAFIAPASNTGAATIQVGSLAAIPLRLGGQPLVAGALVAGAACEVVVSGNGTTADLVPTGGSLPIKGVSDGSAAAAGNVGEVISSNVTTGVPLTSATPANVTSITLTAGDWNVQGEVWIAVGTGGATGITSAISTTSATLPGASALNQARNTLSASITASSNEIMPLRPAWLSVAATTTVYLVGLAIFPSGTTTATGNIWARRAR